MGTLIQLKVASITIDGSKNDIGNDHGSLFQDGDVARCFSDQINYEDLSEDPDEDLASREACFIRALSNVIPRLNFLGYTLEHAKAEYENVLEESKEAFENLVDVGAIEIDIPNYMSFEEFCEFVNNHPFASLDEKANFNDKKLSKGRFANLQHEISRIPNQNGYNSYWSESSFFGSITCILSPYAMLQVYAQSKLNADAEVVWQFGPIVDSGWVDRDAFFVGARRTETILIATEGSSDVRILKHALNLLRPKIADFFRFIDVSESHPFSGTGSLLKFAEGLTKIDVHNQILFLLDNDAEGLSAYQNMLKLLMPKNMCAMTLPDEESFQNFPARGPEGVLNSNINGRAAAIECYLDLDYSTQYTAEVLWSNFKKDVEKWQGALQHKGSYMNTFLDLKSSASEENKYDFKKIERLLDAIIEKAVNLVCENRADREA